jgi:hypothetical protein
MRFAPYEQGVETSSLRRTFGNRFESPKVKVAQKTFVVGGSKEKGHYLVHESLLVVHLERFIVLQPCNYVTVTTDLYFLEELV